MPAEDILISVKNCTLQPMQNESHNRSCINILGSNRTVRPNTSGIQQVKGHVIHSKKEQIESS